MLHIREVRTQDELCSNTTSTINFLLVDYDHGSLNMTFEFHTQNVNFYFAIACFYIRCQHQHCVCFQIDLDMYNTHIHTRVPCRGHIPVERGFSLMPLEKFTFLRRHLSWVFSVFRYLSTHFSIAHI